MAAPPFRPAGVAAATPATTTTRWVDCSNYTGILTYHGIDELKAAGVVGCIVQAITGLDGISHAQQQLGICEDTGLRLQGYVWCFPGGSRASMNERLAMFDGYALEALWLDVEEKGLKIADVDRDLALCDSYLSRLTGIYSGRWFWQDQGWLGLTKWAARPLWNSAYDGLADVDVGFEPYGGWTAVQMKQYQGTSAIGSVQQICLDVMRG